MSDNIISPTKVELIYKPNGTCEDIYCEIIYLPFRKRHLPSFSERDVFITISQLGSKYDYVLKRFYEFRETCNLTLRSGH